MSQNDPPSEKQLKQLAVKITRNHTVTQKRLKQLITMISETLAKLDDVEQKISALESAGKTTVDRNTEHDIPGEKKKETKPPSSLNFDSMIIQEQLKSEMNEIFMKIRQNLGEEE
ncbi:MAG: hypothetical protein ACFFD4_04320 [Candidatus Odinarchaeota archaeon]